MWKQKCKCSNNILIPPQVGNFLTYREVWRDIAKHGYNLCLIVEDDIEFTDYAKQVADSVFKKSTFEAMGFNSKTAFLLRLGWAKCEEHRYCGAKFTSLKRGPYVQSMSCYIRENGSASQ